MYMMDQQISGVMQGSQAVLLVDVSWEMDSILSIDKLLLYNILQRLCPPLAQILIDTYTNILQACSIDYSKIYIVSTRHNGG